MAAVEDTLMAVMAGLSRPYMSFSGRCGLSRLQEQPLSPASDRAPELVEGARRLEQVVRKEVERAADAGADERAGHADVLEVAADGELEAARHRPRVPAAHHLGDEGADPAAPRHRGERHLLERRLEARLHVAIGRERPPEGEDGGADGFARARAGRGKVVEK